MSKEKELKDLFLDTLKDIYFAEKKILAALPKMAKAAQSPKLKAAFEKHWPRPKVRLTRLEQVFASIGETPKGKTCDAIMGILDEGKEIMDEYKGMPALDAGLLAAAQAVEHYEISRYGTLKTWASELGYKDAVKLLDATLKEEKATDSALSQARRIRGQPARRDGASRLGERCDVPRRKEGLARSEAFFYRGLASPPPLAVRCPGQARGRHFPRPAAQRCPRRCPEFPRYVRSDCIRPCQRGNRCPSGCGPVRTGRACRPAGDS